MKDYNHYFSEIKNPWYNEELKGYYQYDGIDSKKSICLNNIFCNLIITLFNILFRK